MSSPDQARVFGMGAEFETATALYEAAKKMRDRGYTHWDTHSPYPIHGMNEAMGLGPSRVSAVSLLGGVIGAILAFALVYYTAYIDYPLVVQGKPYFAFEPTFPIFFELTILLTAFGTLIGMLVFTLLPRLNHPVFNWDRFKKVTDDGFFLIVEARDPLFSEIESAEFLEKIGGTHVTVIREDEG
jgi:hypothetical protein